MGKMVIYFKMNIYNFLINSKKKTKIKLFITYYL